MTAPECRKYETCSAPLCPLDKQALEHGIWYPDEEVCPAGDHRDLPWVQMQKKLVNKSGRADRYFTLEMLRRNCIVRRGIEGLDTDQAEDYQLRKWLSDHPERREMSDGDRQKVARRFAAFRG